MAVSEREARRLRAWAEAGSGPRFGFWARRAWRKLAKAAAGGDPAPLEVLCAMAVDPESARQGDARTAVATIWVRRRSPALRELVVKTGAMAGPATWEANGSWRRRWWGAPAPATDGGARLVTAALHKRLHENWTPEDAGDIASLLSDVDDDVRTGADAAVRVADRGLVEALWGAVEETTSPLAAVLLAHPTPPPQGHLDRVWREWLATASDPLWTALSGWRVPGAADDVQAASLVAVEPDLRRLTEPDVRPVLVECAGRGKHPIAAMAQGKILSAAKDRELMDEVCEAAMRQPNLATFCKRHKLAPSDPVRRALFFVLTRQPEQLRALDPDASLLSLAYASADQRTRTRLQKEMLTSGSLDLVRVLAGEDRRGRIHVMSEDEVRYLTEQLAARGAWEDLWRIVLELPLLRGVRLMRLFTGPWAPRDDDTRELFGRLSTADPDTLERGLKEMHDLWPVAVKQARIKFQGRVNDVSFAPDAALLAVAGSARVAGVVDLTRGELTERVQGFGASVGRVLHLGGGVFVAGERTNKKENECRVVRCAQGRAETIAAVRGSVTSLAAAGPGRYVAGTRSGELLLGANAFDPPRRVEMAELGEDRQQDWPRTVAADPDGQRLAVLGRTLILTDGKASTVLARGYQQTVVARAVLLTPELLATSDQLGDINVLRHQRLALKSIAKTTVEGMGGLAALASRKQLVAATRAGELHFNEQVTLRPAAVIAGPGDGGQATSLHVGSRGDFLAVGYDSGYTDIYDLRIGDLPSLVSRPLASMVPVHLGVLAAARRVREVDGAPGELLGLLRACLEHRFRFDIEISETVALATGEYDIALQ